MTPDQQRQIDLLFGTGDDEAAATKSAIALAAMIGAAAWEGVDKIVVWNGRGDAVTIRLRDPA